GKPGVLDRWFLRRAGHVVVASAREAERCRRLGVAAERLVQTRPAVATASWEPEKLDAIPKDVRILVCVGPLEPHKGFMDAVWAFDLLRFVEDSVHLVLVGEGSDRARLEHFGRITRAESHLVGRQPDAGRYLARADVVWVPSRAAGGVNVA